MKLTVLQENLNRGMTIASRMVATRPQLPVLTHVLLAAEKGRLKIAATNLETGVNLWTGAKIEKEGAISVPAKILSEFVASLSPGKVVLTAEEGMLKISAPGVEASFNGLAASEFPKIAAAKGKPILKIESKVFEEAVAQVAFAAAVDETRPVLTGIYFFIKGKELNMVATDGYRLSLKALKGVLEESLVKEMGEGLIIPARAFQEAAKVTGEEGEVEVYYAPDSNQLVFGAGEAEVVSRLIEGKFPEFEKIIPEEGKVKTEVETEEFGRVVRIASIFARESANIVRFELKKEAIEVSANTAQVGENKSVIEAKVTGGEEKIAFNSRYLLDFLGVVGSETFRLGMSGPLSPGLFRPGKDETFLHVIMPVRVQD